MRVSGQDVQILSGREVQVGYVKVTRSEVLDVLDGLDSYPNKLHNLTGSRLERIAGGVFDLTKMRHSAKELLGICAIWSCWRRRGWGSSICDNHRRKKEKQ